MAKGAESTSKVIESSNQEDRYLDHASKDAGALVEAKKIKIKNKDAVRSTRANDLTDPNLIEGTPRSIHDPINPPTPLLRREVGSFVVAKVLVRSESLDLHPTQLRATLDERESHPRERVANTDKVREKRGGEELIEGLPVTSTNVHPSRVRLALEHSSLRIPADASRHRTRLESQHRPWHRLLW